MLNTTELQTIDDIEILSRWIQVSLKNSSSTKETLLVEGITELGDSLDLFRSVEVNSVKG